MRVLGVDPGKARVGLAISDEARRLALPLCTVAAGKRPAAAVLQALIASAPDADREDERVAVELGSLSAVVVGLPLRLDGTEGQAARAARAFGDRLDAAIREVLGGEAAFELVYWDERLTTVVAERALTEMRVRGPERKAVVDQAAATLLLQSYLDARSRGHLENDSWPAAENETGSEPAPGATARSAAGRGGKKRPKRKKR